MEISIGTILGIIGGIGTVVGVISSIGAVFFRVGRLSAKVDDNTVHLTEVTDTVHKLQADDSSQLVTMGKIETELVHLTKGQGILFKKIDALLESKNTPTAN